MPTASSDLNRLAAADLAACRHLLAGGSRSFYAASFLLPRVLREPASALYAFCRVADDEIDLDADPARALDSLHRRLDAAYAGRPEPFVADRALAAVVEAYGLPRELPEALLEGFAWDAAGRSYEDLSGVLAYSARVAGTVGAMMAVLMGARTPAMVARAADLGVAMQLTNIARDVGEDALAGRLYLPEQWLHEVGIEPAGFLARPVFSDALGSVIERLLGVAEGLYRRADDGIARLPWGCRPGIYAARLLYAEIGHELRRRGLDSVTQRAVVPAAKKLRLVARVPLAAALGVRDLEAPALAETQFLVAAVEAHPAVVPARAGGIFGALAEAERKVVWVLDLFEELDRREQARSGRSRLVDESVA